MQYNELLFGLFNNLKSLYQKHLKFPNISFQQILAIFMIENSGVEMSYFSKKLGIDNSTSTRLIEGLEAYEVLKSSPPASPAPRTREVDRRRVGN